MHIFWALGGNIGLAESAGAELATDRPLWFVIGALWGVSALLIASAAVAIAVDRAAIKATSNTNVEPLTTEYLSTSVEPNPNSQAGKSSDHSRRYSGRDRLLIACCFAIGLVLTSRGLGLQILMLLGLVKANTEVSTAQINWAVWAWNPWFSLGGFLFVITGVRSCRRRETHGPDKSDF